MEYVAVLLPSVVVGLIFWFAMKSIFNADKSERQAEARAQAEADWKCPGGGYPPQPRPFQRPELIADYSALGFPLETFFALTRCHKAEDTFNQIHPAFPKYSSFLKESL